MTADPSHVPLKRCGSCRRNKIATPEAFCLNRSTKSGLAWLCKVCNDRHIKRWREKHPEWWAGYIKAYYADRPAMRSRYARVRWNRIKADPARHEKHKAYKRRWDQEHRHVQHISEQ